MEQVFGYIIALGASVMMPIIFTIIGMCIGMKFGKALKSGLFVGVGFVGLGVVTALLTTNFNSPLKAISDLYHLQLNVFRHPFFPESAAVDPGGFAFEDLNVRCSDDFSVDIGQHPVQLRIGMLKNGIYTTYTIAGTPGVVRCHDGFENIPPVSRALLIERISLGQ